MIEEIIENIKQEAFMKNDFPEDIDNDSEPYPLDEMEKPQTTTNEEEQEIQEYKIPKPYPDFQSEHMPYMR